jgi:hypothetical protein
MLGGGLEPPRLTAYAPQTYVSAISPPERCKRNGTCITEDGARKQNSEVAGVQEALIDAMVLSGCRICGNLTYVILHIEGGARRQRKQTDEQQQVQSKADPGGM